MLDVSNSLKNLRWTTEHHFLHIKNQHDFMRAWAVQFEIAYTDFRVIQMALQLDGQHLDLLKRFSDIYENGVYPYEFEFAGKGLASFNERFGSDLTDYEQKEQELLKIIDEISTISPQD